MAVICKRMNRYPPIHLMAFALLVLLSGCSPYPYERLAIVIGNNENSISITSSAMLQDCVFESSAPTEYAIRRSNYNVKIISESGFKGHMPKLIFSAATPKGVPLVVTGKGKQDQVWIAKDKSDHDLKINVVSTGGDAFGIEAFSLSVQS